MNFNYDTKKFVIITSLLIWISVLFTLDMIKDIDKALTFMKWIIIIYFSANVSEKVLDKVKK